MKKFMMWSKIGMILSVTLGITLTVVFDDLEFFNGGILIAVVILFGIIAKHRMNK